MNRVNKFINDHFISDNLTSESRILNFVCFLGVIASGIALISRIIAGLPPVSIEPLLAMMAAILGVLFMSIKKTRYAVILTTIILCGVSVIFWPLLFFTVGGPKSGMAVYFALAIILDFTLLKGKLRVFAIIMTSVVTVICYVSTLFWNWKVFPEGGLNPYQSFVDNIQSIFIVGFLMGFLILFQTRLYQNEKNKVESANIERDKSILQLKSAQLTVSSMFEVNPHINILFDSSFKVVDCNPAAIKFWGFKTKEEFLFGVVERIIKSIPPFQPDGRPSIPLTERFTAAVKDGYVKFETELDLGGETRNLNVEFKKIPYENSFAIVVYVFDMTNIHAREMELRRSRELNELQLTKLNLVVSELEAAQLTVSAMFESNPHINILFDSNFKVIDCNPAAVRFMGFKTKEEFLAGFSERLINSIPPTLSTGRKTRPIREWFMAAVTEGIIKWETEFILNGRRRNADIELKKIPYGNNFAIVGYIFDTTEIHEREMELKHRDQLLIEAVKAAEAANKAKSAFLSTMSHEIRTPMNAILGITEIQLQDETLDQDIREALSKIYTSGDLLLGIINDILDLSRIESGKLELSIDKYEIASLISDTAQLNMMRIGSKPIEFELHIDENTPANISGDELRVKQILNNILSNAFKYTASGTVKLSVSSDANNDNNEETTLVFIVADTGQGMTEEQVGKLFDEYSRFNMEANRATEGTGLGMSITRNLVRLMNGDISVKSEPGKGSTFTVRLPQGKIGADVLGNEMAENLRQFRTSSRAQMKRVQISREPMPYGNVLIVDDVETNIYVAKGLLAPYELKIESAASGLEAIGKIKKGREYGIIFMDHMMPQMDGVETTKIIRDLGYTQPIVALTANAVSGQADMFLGNGFDDYISKPIDIRQLNAVLNKFIRDKQPPEIIEAAKRQAEIKSNNATQSTVNSRFAEIFVRDALRSVSALDKISEKQGPLNDEDIHTYIIHVHGMKSALANIGKMELSAAALKLEASARKGDIGVISSETPAFLSSLRTLVDSLTPKEETTEVVTTDTDQAYLREKLLEVKAACETYNKKNARELIQALREKAWEPPTRKLLETIAEKLLHSDFDEVVICIEKFMEINPDIS